MHFVVLIRMRQVQHNYLCTSEYRMPPSVCRSYPGSMRLSYKTIRVPTVASGISGHAQIVLFHADIVPNPGPRHAGFAGYATVSVTFI